MPSNDLLASPLPLINIEVHSFIKKTNKNKYKNVTSEHNSASNYVATTTWVGQQFSSIWTQLSRRMLEEMSSLQEMAVERVPPLPPTFHLPLSVLFFALYPLFSMEMTTTFSLDLNRWPWLDSTLRQTKVLSCTFLNLRYGFIGLSIFKGNLKARAVVDLYLKFQNNMPFSFSLEC